MQRPTQRVAFSISGLPGSGSTTCGNNLAATLGLGKPYYSGGAARCLSQKREEIGEEPIVAMYHDSQGRIKLRAMIAEMMVIGAIPARPRIADEYATFPEEFDFLIDEVQKEILEQEHVAVHEGRMVPHLVAQLRSEWRASDKIFIRIFCVADGDERMRRLKNRDEYKDKPIDHIKTETRRRLATEQERYRNLYGVQDHTALEHFDIVIDTTRLSKEETLHEALRGIENLHSGLLAQFLPEK